MPFGNYEDFQSCIDDQIKTHGEESAKKICGKLQSTLGGSVQNASSLTQEQHDAIIKEAIDSDKEANKETSTTTEINTNNNTNTTNTDYKGEIISSPIDLASITDTFDKSKVLARIERNSRIESAILSGAPYTMDQCLQDQSDKGIEGKKAEDICNSIVIEAGKIKAAQQVVDEWQTADNFQDCIAKAEEKYGEDGVTICGTVLEKYGTAKVKPTAYDIIESLTAAAKAKQTKAPSATQAGQPANPTGKQPADTSKTTPGDPKTVPFGGYTDFEACLHDQVNIKGQAPETGVNTCSKMLLQYIKHLRDMQNTQGQNPQPTPGNGKAGQMPPISKAATEQIAATAAAEVVTAASTESESHPQSTNNNMMGAIVDSYGDNNRFFIKAFLLNARTNINRWGVTQESLDRNINSFIGKPLVLMENFNHPNLNDMSMNHALEYQELFRVGSIIDITHSKDDTYYAIIEVTNPAARDALARDANFPIYVSPAIAKLAASEPDDQIGQWTGIHLAIVDDPAYTVKHATITGQCGGTEQQCLLQLKKAHVEKHGYGNCGFCVKGALLNKLNNPGNAVASSTTTTPVATNPTLTPVPLEAQAKVLNAMNQMKAKGKSESDIREAFHSWDHCHSVMMDEYGDKETADTICGYFKSIGQASVSTPTIQNASVEPTKINSSQHMNSDPINIVQTMANNADNNVNAQPNSVPQNSNPTQNTVPNNVPSQQVTPQSSANTTPESATSRSNGGQTMVNVRDETGLFQQEFERLRARNEALEQINSNLTARVEMLTAENNTIKGDYRRSAFERIITSAIIPDAGKRATRIQELLNSNLTPDQVADIYKDFAAINSGQNLSEVNSASNHTPAPQFNFQTASTVSQPAYEAKARMRTASVGSEEKKGNSNWLELRNRIIHSNGTTNNGGIV